MTPQDKTPIRALIEAIEERTWTNYIGASQDAGFTQEQSWLVDMAYHGSLDAAKALHEALLLGWVKWNMQHSYFGYECDLTNGDCDASGVSKDNPARAWLLAILRAHEAQQ